MGYLQTHREGMYAGFSYKKASIRAQEICHIAGETGQTVKAFQHLKELINIMEHAPIERETA